MGGPVVDSGTVWYMNPRFTVGDRLAKARGCAGLKPGAMASKMGVTPRTITRWERTEDEDEIKDMTFWAYSSITGVSYEWLKYGDDPGEAGTEVRSRCFFSDDAA